MESLEVGEVRSTEYGARSEPRQRWAVKEINGTRVSLPAILFI